MKIIYFHCLDTGICEYILTDNHVKIMQKKAVELCMSKGQFGKYFTIELISVVKEN